MAWTQDDLDRIDDELKALALRKASLSGDGLSAVEHDIEKLSRFRDWVAEKVSIAEGGGISSVEVSFGRLGR